ncbi:hypothetical protein [Methanococcoides sp. AM1]|uniref:hypothetical protein n=1 Tax=Methanococcoides sp. AM1 TaxID=1201011 RepID=UPI0010824FFD|nr:hypothetical protein [Methanococcoides sp. AM1]
MENSYDRSRTNVPVHSLSSYEMGSDDVNVVCTYGKISVWFGRQTPDVVVGQTLIAISKVDKSAVYETELICDFDSITNYESNGYVLVSYAKANNGYRAMFNVPFHSNKALFHLAENIIKELKTDDASLDIYWNGDDSDITKLSDEFKKIEGWNIKEIIYKD